MAVPESISPDGPCRPKKWTYRRYTRCVILIYNHRCLCLLYVGSINPIQLFSKTKTWNKTFHQTWKFMTWSLLPSNHHVVSVKVQFRNGSLSNRWPLSRDKMIHFSTIVCIGPSKFKILINFCDSNHKMNGPVHFMTYICIYMTQRCPSKIFYLNACL